MLSANIGRMGKWLATVLLAVAALWGAGEPAGAAAEDLEGHWAQGVINFWLRQGLIDGREDGTVRPDEPVTRAEFVVLANRIFRLPPAAAPVFADTPQDSWYSRDLRALVAAGVLSADPGGRFNPDEPIERQEAAVLLHRLAQHRGSKAGTSAAQPAVADLAEASPSSREAILALAAGEYIERTGPFRPTDPLTRAEAIAMLDRFYTEAERPNPAAVSTVFAETFDDKRVSGWNILDESGRAVWSINRTPEQTFAIVEDGSLELGGARFMQMTKLQDDRVREMDGYVMEFTVNLQRMSNEGHSGRPMIAIIPRTKDPDYREYYGIYYYMETTYMGNIVANLFKTRWTIVNTAAPSGTKPLAEGFFLLKENVDYIARLIIENTEDGGVHIAFYLDGPTDPVNSYEPVVAYTDYSRYKILSSAAGPAFGMSGRGNDLWGHPSTVRFDDVRIMERSEYDKLSPWLERFAARAPSDLDAHPLRDEIKYVLNRGWIDLKPGNRFEPNRLVTEAEFAAALRTLSGSESFGAEAGGETLTKARAARWIHRLLGEPLTLMQYRDLLAEPGYTPDAAEHYAFERGILGLEKSGRFEPEKRLNRAEAALLLLRVADAGYRLPHGKIRLPSILSSGAVLQRDKPIPIWGTGTSGETITVQFRRQTKTAKVVDGHWSVTLDPEPYGGPDRLIVRGLRETIVLNDVLVGEVFIVAGQSNAEMPMSEVNDTKDTIRRLKDRKRLRYYFADQVLAASPRFDDGGSWNIAYEWMLLYSPSIGTFFVDKLMQEKAELRNVPIGVIMITYGGSTIELFLPDSLMRSQNYVQHHDEPIMSGFWNGYMDSVSPYAVKAVLYYQGENSTQLGYSYEPLLRAYLRAIRREFRDPELPVSLVQLAGYGENYYESDLDSWPIIREIQMRVANTTPHTELVTAVDLADVDPLEIHPKDKKPIGERIAYRALATMYGDPAYERLRSPEVAEARLEGGTYRLSFRYLNDRLTMKDSPVTGFEILDSSGKWLPARARVEASGREMLVWRDGLPEPLGVRYLWRNYPTVTLFDERTGLPVLPYNSTKNLREIPKVPGTDEHHIRIMNHFLNSYDAIVNLSRGNAFRMVEVRDGHLLWHEFAIPGQQPGDEIARYSRLPNRNTGAGTTETIVYLSNHGLKAGDWIRNNTRAWTPSRVAEVLNINAFVLETPIPGQSEGDELELYSFKGISTAMGSFEE